MKKILLNIPNFLQNINKNEYKNSKIKELYSFGYLNKSCCSLACLQMCIKYFLNQEYSLLSIFEKSLEFHVIEKGLGAIHYKLIELARSYGLEGCLIREERRDRFITLINFMLKNNIAIIASVKSKILKGNLEQKGGHLVLIRGIDNQKLYINDPHNVSNYSELNKEVDFDRFFDNFSGNLICFSNSGK